MTLPRFAGAFVLLALTMPARGPGMPPVTDLVVVAGSEMASDWPLIPMPAARLTAESRPFAASPQAVPAAPPDELGALQRAYLVSESWNYLGVRYRYGGLTHRGIDCSGFIRRIMQAHNLYAPRTVSQLWAAAKPIPEDDRHPGDLVFFRLRAGLVSHVGLYLGGESFIHASVSRGVTVSTLDKPYWRRNYAGTRRLPEAPPEPPSPGVQSFTPDT